MFGGFAVLSFSVAFLFSIVFEAPFMLIDKKYLTGKLSKLQCSCWASTAAAVKTNSIYPHHSRCLCHAQQRSLCSYPSVLFKTQKTY